MSKAEFLLQLREDLRGQVSQKIINENLDYYENYILQELRKGKTEESIIEELGNPRMLAQTIIDTADGDLNGGAEYQSSNEEQGYNKVITGRKAKLILFVIILAIILVLIGLCLLIGGLISVIAPFVLPLILIMLAIRIIGRRR